MGCCKFLKSFISIFFFFLVFSISPVSAQTGLQNSSYEDGLIGWVDTASDSVTVIAGENTTTRGNNQTFDIDVAPLNGTKLVRLGGVKNISENMNVGPNSVSQTFNSNSDKIIIGFRLYSWEHREADTFSLNVTQTSDPAKKFTITNRAGTAPLSISMYAGEPVQVCSETPCVLNVNSGKRGDFVNTGWQYVIISGLPSDGTADSEVTVTYSLDGVSNEGHPSWAYIDNWNHDPVADFSSPDLSASTIEGNVTKFLDHSYDPDPGDEIIKRVWEISYTNDSGGTHSQTVEDAKELSVIASNQGSVVVSLTVYDSYGGSDTIKSGEIRPDGLTTAPTATYDNSPIFVNKLQSYQVVAGSTGNIITARYKKPGWDDSVNATWSISSGGGSLQHDKEDNIALPIPMMLSGLVAIPFDAPDTPGTTVINLIVSDGDGESVSRDITVEILPQSDFVISDDYDGNDSIAELSPANENHVVKSGQVKVGHLNRLGDVDYYKVTDADGNNFPVGSEVYIRMRNTSNDHDMFLLGPAAVISDEEVDSLARVYSSRLARVYSSRLARVYSSRLARVFSSRLARVYSSRLARVYSSRLARVYSSRLARVYSSRLARVYSSRLARVYSSRLEGEDDSNVVIFTTPLSEGYSWEEAVENNLLHSLAYRDSDLNAFSEQSILNGFSYEQFPLTESVFLPIPEDSTSQKDIDISETILGDLSGTGYQVDLFSSNDGFDDEAVLIRITEEGDTYIAIASDSGFGSPYSIQVENSIPTNLEHITDGSCNGTELVQNGSDTASGIVAHHGDNVMYVVNPQRMVAMYGQSRWDALYAEIESLAVAKEGKILAINELAEYANMDRLPCRVENTNIVAKAVRDAILANRGETDSVILFGSDNIIPFYRVIDPSDYTERDYVAHTQLTPSSPMYSAMFNSYILTDKYFANDFELDGNGSKIMLPKWGVSRVVETPEDMLSAIENHKMNIGMTNISTGMVSAYDVVLDSGQEIYNSLSLSLNGDVNGGPNLIDIPAGFDSNTTWYATNIRCHMMGAELAPGTPIPGCESDKVVDLVSLNGHFTHDTLISKAAFDEPILCAANPDSPECLELKCGPDLTAEECFESKYLTSDHITLSANGNLSGNHIYSPGCHKGLNVSEITDSGSSASQYSDFPASYVSSGATLLGGTGYGIAGVNTNSFSERLMTWHSKTITKGEKIGLRTADADVLYILEQAGSGLSPFDIKTMYQSTLYGFADTTIEGLNPLPIEVSSVGCTLSSTSWPGGGVTGLNVKLIDGDSVLPSPTGLTYKEVCTDGGVYFEGNAGTYTEDDRPVQPAHQFSIVNSVNNIRTILLEEATYQTSSNSIDAVFVTPTSDNETSVAEQNFCNSNRHWPTKLVNHEQSIEDGIVNTEIDFVGGQFTCDAQNSGYGYQRLYETATLRILRSDSSDTIPPTIHSVDLLWSDEGIVSYEIDASDASGIKEIILTIYLPEGIKVIKSGPLTGESPYDFELSYEDSLLAINNNTALTVIDGANNSSIFSSKGRGMEAIDVKIENGGLISILSPKAFTATIKDFTTRRELAHSMSYVWDFGDGQFETGVVFNKNDNDGDDDYDYLHPDLVINADGSATITTIHDYQVNTNVNVKFKVTDAAGGIGSDIVELQTCSDPSDFNLVNGDLVACDVTSSGNLVNITVKVADGGDIATSDFQYRLYLDFNNDGVSDLKLTYDNGSIGKTNKVGSLTATAQGELLTISFDPSKTGWTQSIPLNWYMETQSGVVKGKANGFTDMMPDKGYFSY